MNTFWFLTGGGSVSVAADAIIPLLEDFYNVDGGSGSVSSFLGPQCSRAVNASSLTWYDTTEAEPRTPHVVPFTLAGSTLPESTVPLPAEVALVLSLQAAGNGPRDRGRLFIGPFAEVALGGTLSNDSIPNNFLRDTLLEQAALLANGAQAVGFPWCINSRADGVLKEIIGGFVDNAWDTQRRRGIEATARVGWIRGA